MKDLKASMALEELFEEWKSAHCEEAEEDYLKYRGGNVPKHAFLPDGIIDTDQFGEKKKTGESLLFIAKEAYWYTEKYSDEKYLEAVEKPKFWHREASRGAVDETIFSKRLSMMANAFYNKDYAKVDKDHHNLQSTAVINLNKRGGFAYCKWETLEGYVASYCRFIEKEIEIINPDVIVCCGAGVKWLLDKYVCIDKGIKVVSIYHPSYFALTDEDYLNHFECALEGKEWKLTINRSKAEQAEVPMKGIIFDTNKTYSDTSTFDMLTSNKISAYGDASRYIERFNTGDIVFFYVSGKGVVAAGEICSKTEECKYYDSVEKYKTVRMISPLKLPNEEKDLKFIKPSEIKKLLGEKGFFWASTIKVPYLHSKEECDCLIAQLRRINNEEDS